MKKIIFVSCCMLWVYCCSVAQETYNPYATKIKQEAEKMSAMLLKTDHESFVEYVYPAIVKKMRGNRYLIGLLRENKDNILIKHISLEDPSKIISYKGELQCTLQEIMELVVGKKRMMIKSTLIAVSQDKGKRWYFVDATQNLKTLQEGLPNLSDSLEIPIREKPIVLD